MSARSSVTRVLCDKIKQCTVDILIPHERAMTPTIVGGRRHLPSEICAQSDPYPFEKSRLRQISAYTLSYKRQRKKVQLWRIGSRQRAFQRAIDGVRTLPPKTSKRRLKSECFKNKIRFQLNRVCNKVSLCETFRDKVIVWSFPYLVVHRYWPKRNPST